MLVKLADGSDRACKCPSGILVREPGQNYKLKRPWHQGNIHETIAEIGREYREQRKIRENFAKSCPKIDKGRNKGQKRNLRQVGGN